MKRLATLLSSILTVNAFALDPIWDTRYTFGPDSKPAPKFGIGLGGRTSFDNDMLFPVNIVGSLTRDWDLGAKVDVHTQNKLHDAIVNADIGARYRLRSGSFFELDGSFGLNRNNGSAVVVTYGRERYIAKNFSNYYDFRAGFLDAIVEDDGYAKVAASMMPTLHFGSSVQAKLEVTTSASIGHISKDFMVDILPKLEIVLGSARIRMDLDIGVMQEKNNNQKSVALYVMTAL